jgi:Fe-S-cluster containining protein
MFLNNQCSIYEDRPQTCRDYDCRVFAATGISVDGEAQPEIARRVSEWVFEYGSEESRAEQAVVMEAAAFLRENRELFPAGALPGYPVQLAALAVEVYRVFADCQTLAREDRAAMPDACIALAILAAMSEPEAPEKMAVKGKKSSSRPPGKRP